MSSSSADVAWRRVGADGSITLTIHAQPGAKKTEVAGVHGAALKIRLAAPAVEGKANDALIAFFAASFGVPRRNVMLVRGETGRRKTVRIASPAARPDRDWGEG
ncbi:MAG TPA: DUF167 domain-containing protein [Burkholderiales bacterium]|nr:DUF167 domain-containing protein [Burkholderiales bacterium]